MFWTELPSVNNINVSFVLLISEILALILNGCLLTMIAMWGCEIAFVPNRLKTTLYMISLLIIYGFSIFSYIRSQHIADSIGDNLTAYWGTWSATTRSNIQDFVSFTFHTFVFNYFIFVGLLLWITWSNRLSCFALPPRSKKWLL